MITKSDKIQVLGIVAWGLILAVPLVSAAADAGIQFETIDISSGNGTADHPAIIEGISDDGSVVVGRYATGDSGSYDEEYDEFLWKDGTLVDLLSLLGPEVDSTVDLGVSGDGSVIIGVLRLRWNEGRAFRFKDGEVTILELLPGTDGSSRAVAVSTDGTVVAGSSGGSSWSRIGSGVRWDDGVMVSIGDLEGGDQYSVVNDMTADGEIIVGRSGSALIGFEAFRWENGVMTGLGNLPGEDYSDAVAVSEDGSTVIGSSESQDGGYAFRWKDGVMEPLVYIPGWSYGCGAYAVSEDGSVVVGRRLIQRISEYRNPEAFRWEDGVFTGLGKTPGRNSYATHVSRDGTVVCGTYRTSESGWYEQRAVFWSEATAWQPVALDVLLDAAGIDREGFRLKEPALTPDGSTFVGYATKEEAVRLYRLQFSPGSLPEFPERRLANFSTRGRLSAGDDVLIAGLVITGAVPQRVLIRASGSSLSNFGVDDVLADTVLTIFNADGDKLATNTNWEDLPNVFAIEGAVSETGAFAFPAGSTDSAILITLDPGAYTAQVTGNGGATGNALVEVYGVD